MGTKSALSKFVGNMPGCQNRDAHYFSFSTLHYLFDLCGGGHYLRPSGTPAWNLHPLKGIDFKLLQIKELCYSTTYQYWAVMHVPYHFHRIAKVSVIEDLFCQIYIQLST